MFHCPSILPSFRMSLFYPVPFQIVERGLEKAVVLEDDVRFGAHFRKRLLRLMEDLEQAQLNWDLMYGGFVSGYRQVSAAVQNDPLQPSWKTRPQNFRVLSFLFSDTWAENR